MLPTRTKSFCISTISSAGFAKRSTAMFTFRPLAAAGPAEGLLRDPEVRQARECIGVPPCHGYPAYVAARPDLPLMRMFARARSLLACDSPNSGS